MFIISKLEVEPTVKLDELRTLIFKDVWAMPPFKRMVQHGCIEEIRVSDEEFEIITDDDLWQRLAQTSNFQVIFRKPEKPPEGS
jgi:hypothetical protein